MQVGDERFDSKEIHRCYKSIDFPLGSEQIAARAGCQMFAQANLQEPRTKAQLDNALSLGNNLLRAAFFEVDRTIWPWRSRTGRKDRRPPSLSYGGDLNPTSLVLNDCHRSRLRNWINACRLTDPGHILEDKNK